MTTNNVTSPTQVDTSMALDTNDFDIFSSLDDVVIETAEPQDVTEETVEHITDDDRAGFAVDDEDVSDLSFDEDNESFNPENTADALNHVVANIESYDDETRFINGLSLGEAKERLSNGIAYDQGVKAHDELNGELQDLISQFKAQLPLMVTEDQKKLDEANHILETSNDPADIQKAIKNKRIAQQKLKENEHLSKSFGSVNGVVDGIQTRQAAQAFKMEAQRNYGNDWGQKVDEIGAHYSDNQDIIRIAKANPNFKLLEVLRKAKAYDEDKSNARKRVSEATKRPVKKTVRGTPNTTGKGVQPEYSGSKKKMAERLAKGDVSSAEVFAALED